MIQSWAILFCPMFCDVITIFFCLVLNGGEPGKTIGILGIEGIKKMWVLFFQSLVVNSQEPIKVVIKILDL